MQHQPLDVNTDLSVFVAIDSSSRPWEASPSQTVWRKSFYRQGGEAGPVTSLVRYDANSSFARHEHPEGEEILVLDGVFSDEHGDWPAGSFLLNPPGSAHSPRSLPGCRIFVHLRQYGGPGRQQARLDTRSMPWLPTGDRGVSRRTLYTQDGFTASMHLERWAAGTQVTLGAGGGLAELFVLSGTLTSPFGGHRAESWIRAPGRRDGVTWSSSEGCTLYRRAT